MNIKIGDKIRKLRQRDGRKQEDIQTLSVSVLRRFHAGRQTAGIPILNSYQQLQTISMSVLMNCSAIARNDKKN